MQLAPYISQCFDAAIWRMEIDELTDTLFIELRNQEEKKVAFAAISLRDGSTLFNNLTTPERWLTGIEAAYDGVLLLHFYESDSTPRHRGLLAIEAITGKQLWCNYAWAFDHLSARGPLVYDTRIQPGSPFLTDIRTGIAKPNITGSIFEPLESNIVVPEMISSDMLPTGTLFEVPYGNLVHYLEYNNFRIVSLHTLDNGRLTQKLFISDCVNVVYEDLLNAAIQKIQPEAFMVHKNRLIYIKNKLELKVLTL